MHAAQILRRDAKQTNPTEVILEVSSRRIAALILMLINWFVGRCRAATFWTHYVRHWTRTIYRSPIFWSLSVVCALATPDAHP